MSTLFQAGMTFSQTAELVVKNCPACGIVYAIPKELNDRLFGRDFGKGWYCPNGHNLCAIGKSPAQIAEEQFQRERAEHDQTQASRDHALQNAADKGLKLRATKGVVTRIKNRIARGVCPCCDRYFRDLHSHLAHEHPDYEKKDD